MKQEYRGLRPLAVLSLMSVFRYPIAQAQQGQPVGTEAGKPPYNIIFVISDQRTYRLFAGDDYPLPGIDAIARHGVTFRNHYIASAMCTPSRAAFLSGQPPQVNGVFDQMELGYVPNLRPDSPNMGSVLKGLGYATAYFGKFEMKKELLMVNPSVGYSAALQPYGFDFFNFNGDFPGTPDQGYHLDRLFSAEAVTWLRTHEVQRHEKGQPFFMVVSFLNPHDIMFADTNIPGRPPVQKALGPVLTPPPANSIYAPRWKFTSPPGIKESLTAPGMPLALSEYHKGWSGSLGYIPADRSDMWDGLYHYYLNLIRDNDRGLQLLLNAMDEMNLWKNCSRGNCRPRRNGRIARRVARQGSFCL